MLIKRINKSLLLIALGITFLAATPIMVKAESLQQQIDTLQNTNKSVQSNIDNLQVQATSYQDAVRILQTQINSAQNAINASQKSIDDLQVKIDKAQKDLDYQKGSLEIVMKKLGNERFMANAKPEILASEQKKKADIETRIKTIEESLILL